MTAVLHVKTVLMVVCVMWRAMAVTALMAGLALSATRVSV